MDIIKISPLNEGKQTEITLSMTAEEGKRFMQLLAEGKLEHVGIVGASIAPGNTATLVSNWTTTEEARRTKSSLENEPGRP